jgi:hypothetical protein
MRSRKPITPSDLQRLAQIARSDRQDFFKRYPRWSRLYSKRLLCVALCQGAAQHFVDGKNGVKDFDVWSFFREITGHPPIPYRRVGHSVFGLQKLGASKGKSDFIGRRVDLIFRSIPFASDRDPLASLFQYLTQGRTDTARCLADQAIVIIEPPNFEGKVAWLKRHTNRRLFT